MRIREVPANYHHADCLQLDTTTSRSAGLPELLSFQTELFNRFSYAASQSQASRVDGCRGKAASTRAWQTHRPRLSDLWISKAIQDVVRLSRIPTSRETRDDVCEYAATAVIGSITSSVRSPCWLSLHQTVMAPTGSAVFIGASMTRRGPRLLGRRHPVWLSWLVTPRSRRFG